ncbi:HipA domain-containing protein [Cerasicoccus frondis]|uniref:type II toxin-antitoxin system HipA family toxin n=1 Tax=Cerasicoccus frondis TaxID=490090 RepID=UPI002852987B|nr:HipA domain-containing protein [Cerasicoccus frondis]
MDPKGGLSQHGNKDKELEAPKGYGVIEYAYHLMATAARVQMSECRLLEENGRRHFITKRFDRHNDEKLQMQSLCALQHYDFNNAGAYAYEQAFLAIRQLGLGTGAVEAQYRRMLFNVVARNQDDHVKNIAFLMNKAGQWSLSPAFDVIYSYNPSGAWTSAHQMSINGKRDDFTLADFEACAKPPTSSKAAEKPFWKKSWTQSGTGRSLPPQQASTKSRLGPSAKRIA